MTQKADVIDYLQSRGSITRMEAFLELGVCELPARIIELESDGYRIPRRTVEVSARNGRRVRVTQYLQPAPLNRRREPVVYGTALVNGKIVHGKQVIP